MKIAVIADTHLGVKWGTEREQDSFDQAKEAFERALELGAELIILLGDIFDVRTPRQEVWARALRILSLPLTKRWGKLELNSTIDKSRADISPLSLRGIPVIALHGNHERRTRGFVNPVQALEAAGLLIHLHHNTVVFDTPEKRLAIHGMSNVPEQYAKTFLATWNPKPIKDALNILILHQSLGQYKYSIGESPTIDLPDLPFGFDLYLCGHVHYRIEATIHDKPLLFPGSTERTQLLKIEATIPKGFYMLDLNDGLSYEFIELGCARDFFYEEMGFSNAKIHELVATAKMKIHELLKKPRRNSEKLPLIRLRLLGTIAKEASRSDFDERAIIQEFSDRALITISKDDLTTPGLEEKIQLLRDLRERRLSIDEMAMGLLEANLREMGYSRMFDVSTLYHFLVEDKQEEALRKILEVVRDLIEAEKMGIA